ncbi:MAG: hypothetical protein AB7F89_25915 [Pirellulaceae bacterium]
MRTVELLEEAITTAEKLGYRLRHEWLGGCGGGACEFGGRRWLFVDLALTVDEQLDQVCHVLRTDPGVYLVDVPHPLRRLLERRRAA